MKYYYFLLAYNSLADNGKPQGAPVTGVFITDCTGADYPELFSGAELPQALAESRADCGGLFWRAVPYENGADQIAQIRRDCGRV